MTTTTIQRPALTEQDIRKAIEASATSTDALRWVIGGVVLSHGSIGVRASGGGSAGPISTDRRRSDTRLPAQTRLSVFDLFPRVLFSEVCDDLP